MFDTMLLENRESRSHLEEVCITITGMTIKFLILDRKKQNGRGVLTVKITATALTLADDVGMLCVRIDAIDNNTVLGTNVKIVNERPDCESNTEEVLVHQIQKYLLN